MKTVAILNAPPESGKDTIADLMVKHLHASKHEFKAAIYQAFAEHFKLPLSYVLKICTDRKYKDTCLSTFALDNGMTPRAGLIHVSEDIYKLRKGSDYFGRKAAEGLTVGVNAFSDGGGWWDELVPVAKAADQVIIFRMFREGFTFKGDSRSYYDPESCPDIIWDKIRICDVQLVDGKPYAALDDISAMLDNVAATLFKEQ